MNKPIRIQRKRTKGWRMPPNTVYVGRPTKWGNPYKIGDLFGPDYTDRISAFGAKHLFITYALRLPHQELRGKNLACWCALDQPCHADVLLEIANA